MSKIDAVLLSGTHRAYTPTEGDQQAISVYNSKCYGRGDVEVYILLSVFWGGQEEGGHGRFH